MSKRKGMSADVFDALLPDSPAEKEDTATSTASRAKKTKSARKPKAAVRAPLSVSIDADLVEQARDVVYWSPGLSLTELVAEALRREIGRREKSHGGAFPPRTGELTPGPPVR